MSSLSPFRAEKNDFRLILNYRVQLVQVLVEAESLSRIVLLAFMTLILMLTILIVFPLFIWKAAFLASLSSAPYMGCGDEDY